MIDFEIDPQTQKRIELFLRNARGFSTLEGLAIA